MKVLVLHSELGVLRGGGENFTRNLFSAFAARGHHVAAAFVADRQGRYPIQLPSNIEPLPMGGWWSRNLGQTTFSTIGRYIPPASRLKAGWDRVQDAISWRTIRWHDRRFHRRIEHELSRAWGDFDVVYVHGSPTLASAVARHRPTVLRLPGPVTFELAPLLRTVQAVCANGDTLLQIRSFLGDEVIELPIGIDSQRFRPENSSVRPVLGWTAQQPVVGYVGRLTHLKGVDLLAAAFRELSHNVSNARLLIVGNGPEEKYLRSVLAKELAIGSAYLKSDVAHEELPSWYRAMDLLVMPSRYENFSNAVLEAMACGVPFLASDIGGNKMLAATGAGWLFQPASVPSLSSCLRKILESSPDMKAYGELGSSYVRGCCSWQACAQRLEEIIVSRLGGKV